jgi:hypothetical protein
MPHYLLIYFVFSENPIEFRVLVTKAGQLQYLEAIFSQYQIEDILLVYFIKGNNFVYLLVKDKSTLGR